MMKPEPFSSLKKFMTPRLDIAKALAFEQAAQPYNESAIPMLADRFIEAYAWPKERQQFVVVLMTSMTPEGLQGVQGP